MEQITLGVIIMGVDVTLDVVVVVEVEITGSGKGVDSGRQLL